MRINFLLAMAILAQLFSFIYPESKNLELPMVVVIPSYNNKDWYERNLSSLEMQDYGNYRAIYVDDCSMDGTGDLVEKYIKEHGLEHKITLIKNKERCGALANLYNMIHSCDDKVIVVNLDGDDWFPDKNVLSRLNAVYSAKDVWITYGQFVMYPANVSGWCAPTPDEVVKNNTFRPFAAWPYVYSHLRTFKAALFKSIKLEDFLNEGSFFPMAWDMTIMFPMMEMASERHHFFSEPMYVYNYANPLSDCFKDLGLQQHLTRIMLSKTPYTRMPELEVIEDSSFYNNPVDVIVCSNFDMEKVNNFTSSINSFLNTSALKIHFIFNDESFADSYNYIVSTIKSDYVMLCTDNAVLTKTLELSKCIEALERTKAHAFYFYLEKSSAGKLKLNNGIYAWAFGQDQLCRHCLTGMTLYRKSQLPLEVNSFANLENYLLSQMSPEKVGLCFENTIVTEI